MRTQQGACVSPSVLVADVASEKAKVDTENPETGSVYSGAVLEVKG